MNAKELVISDVYFNVRTGFRSIAETLKQSRRRDATITRADVTKFLNKQDVNQKRKRNRYNSFVPPFPREQYQIDLADFGEGTDFRYAFVCIDIFTKMLAVIPLKSKLSQSTSEALDEVFLQMGHPVSVLTDIGGEFQGAFSKRLQYYSVNHIVTRTPPIFVERVIRTLKDNIRKRMQVTRIPLSGWWRFLEPVVEQYNGTVHESTKLSPKYAHENLQNPENVALIRDNMQERARFNRKYSDIDVGDQVKIIRKPGKYSEYKSGFVAWSSEVYTISSISYNVMGQRQYNLSNYSTPLLRHELLKIEGSETPNLRRVEGKQEVSALLNPAASKASEIVSNALADPQATSSAPPPRRRLIGKQTVPKNASSNPPSNSLIIEKRLIPRNGSLNPSATSLGGLSQSQASAPENREVLDSSERFRRLHLERARLIMEGNWPPRDPNILSALLGN